MKSRFLLKQTPIIPTTFHKSLWPGSLSLPLSGGISGGSSIKKLNNIFIRNYFRSVSIPQTLISSASKFYIDELQPYVASGNFNPSFEESSQLQIKINRYLRDNSQLSEVKNFTKILDEFVNRDSSTNKNDFLTVLELTGLNQPLNQSLTQDIYFKVLTISAIIESFGIKRLIDGDSPAIGFANNSENKFLPAHCDKMNDDETPQFVGIVTIKSNSKAFTFFTENHLIYKNLKMHHPQSLKILEEVLICKIKLNQKGFFEKTKPHKIINYNDDGSIFLNYNFLDNPYILFDPQNSKYSQKEVDKAIEDFSTICLNLSESFKFVCDEKNNVLFFDNCKVLHGLSIVNPKDIRKMVYLPCESVDNSKPKNIIEKNSHQKVKSSLNSLHHQ
jgi:hypothetical protein